ncbi:MAG: hypothetical protein JXA13_03960 [Anaerolineales bacterium]|nr:hypothetical protein [Anaerolineales bacterium]
MIRGRILLRRDVFDMPRGNRVGSIEAGQYITASENIYQWLHLTGGGWVVAGLQQQYIEWKVVADAVETPNLPVGAVPMNNFPAGSEEQTRIKGRTILKCPVFTEPAGDRPIDFLDANSVVTASEHIFQWLHLDNGGWVNAGTKQQYITWAIVREAVEASPVEADPEPGGGFEPYSWVITRPPPVEPWPITEIKRRGRIATLLVDYQNPRWGFKPRLHSLGRHNAHPQTVPFSIACSSIKGPGIPLKEKMLEYLVMLNGEKVKDIILKPGSGWVNIPTLPGTIERLSWAGNHVVVKGTRVQDGVEYASVHAMSCNQSELIGNFFDKDLRLILHKFNAVTRTGLMIKIANKRDCFTPFITDPDLNKGDMWIPSAYLEFWPELPFTLSDGVQILEYELYGYSIYGRRADGRSILLRDLDGFKTNWRINSPEVPV